MTGIRKYAREFLCLFSLLCILSIGIYWVGNLPTDPWVLFGLNAGLFFFGFLFLFNLIKLWRTKWKEALKEGLRKLLAGLASLFIAIVEKWNEAQNDQGHLGGKTSVTFDLFRAEKEDKKSSKLPKWKHLQTDRERMRFLYRSMMTERVKKGALVYSSETPSELKQKQENQEHEEALFDLYISHRYDERQQPSEEAIENLKEQFHIK